MLFHVTDSGTACWVPIIYFFFPETKGLELEDVDRLFAKEGSEELRKMSVDVRRMSVREILKDGSMIHGEYKENA
jgi:hypothetical protein